MKIRRLRRIADRYLTMAPTLYGQILDVTGRGSTEKRLYLKLVHRGDVVFDVGANFGHFTLLFSDLIGPNGSVHAFEPVVPTFENLSRRIKADALYANIVIKSAACSDKSGSAEITVPGDDYGQASMCQHQMGSWATTSNLKTYPIQTIKLDDYAASQSLKVVDFIKCDAEGAELLVLRGAVTILQRWQPLLSLEIAEFWTSDFGYCAGDLANFLIGCGYSDFIIGEEFVEAENFRSRLVERTKADSQQVICADGAHAGQLKALAKYF
jgi:FkbM family methyltransferase